MTANSNSVINNRYAPPSCLFIHSLPFELLEGAEADGRLRDAAVYKDREATVEARHAALLYGLPRTVDNAAVFTHLYTKEFVKLPETYL